MLLIVLVYASDNGLVWIEAKAIYPTDRIDNNNNNNNNNNTVSLNFSIKRNTYLHFSILDSMERILRSCVMRSYGSSSTLQRYMYIAQIISINRP